ncbi:MAG: dehydrogenase [Asgard group archaeon]|nr:dehydrogenase [Asgard group archaeon]
MKGKAKNYELVPFPKGRRLNIDLYDRAVLHHVVHGLTEYDVTDVRKYIKDVKEKTGENYSFTGFLASCVAKAIDENKILNSMRKGRKNMVIFDDVDISILVETEVNWKKIPMLYVIRAANKKSYKEINEEIQKAKVGQISDYKKQSNLVDYYLIFPKFIRKIILKQKYVNNPFFRKRIGGTVSLTSVGMFADAGGWGIPLSLFTLFVTLGGIQKKPAVINDEIKIRELLSITYTVDHDLVDGAPIARFQKRVKELVEKEYGTIIESNK